MAKVISWILNDKYLYLSGNTSGTVISNTELPSTFVNELAYFWRDKSLAQYTTAFEDLKTKASNTFGLTNLRDAGDYFNVLAQDGVVMISGKDGKNIADSGTPFYNIHLLNENIAVGIGSDSTLDTAASAITQLFIERNGVVRNEDIEQVTVNSTIQGFTYQVIEGEDYWTVILGIPANTQFENSTKTHSTIINVRAKNDYVGKAVFTITGILNGTDGSTYNLVVTPKVINRSASGFFSNDIVTAQCVKDFAPVTSTELMKIQYSWTPEGQKYDYSEPIAVEQIYNNGSTCLFYLLYYNGSGFVTIDSETCTIVQDGTNGTDFTSLELGNEMDGVGLGNDGVVDNGAVLGTSLKLYKGATKSNLISEVKIEGLSDYGHASCDVYNGATLSGSKLFTATGVSFTNLQLNNASFVIRLSNGYTFNEDRREELLVSVVGTIGSDNSVTASGNYVIIGIQGGEDGVVYKVQPSCDTVIYDPNTNAYSETSISCAAFPNTLTIGDKYKLYYSLDEAFNTLSPGMYLYAAPLTGDSIFSQYRRSVVFYLFYESVLLDRETVTFVHQGIDAAERVYIELSNEIDAVALGGDYVLDVDVEFTLGLTLYSGESKTEFSTLMIDADSDFDGCECTLFTNADSAGTIFSGSTAAFSGISNSGEATVVIYVSGGTLDFSDGQKKAIRFTATAAADEREGTGIYTVVGVMDGEDGVVYRVMPEYSSIAYNPESGLYSPTAITCDAYASATKIEFEGETLTNTWYSIRYTDGSLANPTFENTTALTKSGVVSASITSGVIVFYLFYKSNSWVLLDRETVPIVKDGDKGDAPVWLELSTESATVSCFNNGTVLPYAALPECTATLKRGNAAIINATYDILTSNTEYTGVSIDSETGEITIDRTLEFTGTTLLLTIRAIAELASAVTVFSITKAFSGVAGRTIRRSVWELGKSFYDGTTPFEDTSGDPIYYLDIVTNNGCALSSESVTYWCCIQSHVSSSENQPTAEGNQWWAVVEQTEPLMTPLLLASQIGADFIDVNGLVVNHLEVLDEDDEKVILSAGVDKDYPLICGGNGHSSEAVTKISSAGTFTTIEGEIGGWKIGDYSLSSKSNIILLDSLNGVITINDEDGNTVSSFENNEYTKASLTFGGTIAIGTGDTNYYFSSTNTDYGVNKTFSIKTGSFAIPEPEPGSDIDEVFIRMTNLVIKDIYIYPDRYQTDTVNGGKINIEFNLCKEDGTVIEDIASKEYGWGTGQTAFIDAMDEQPYYIYKNPTTLSRKVAPGDTYYFMLKVRLQIYSSTGKPDYRNRDMMFLCNFSRSTNLVWGGSNRINRYFANGFASSLDTDNKFISLIEGSQGNQKSSLEFLSAGKNGVLINSSTFGIRVNNQSTSTALRAPENTLPAYLRVGNSCYIVTGNTTINYSGALTSTRWYKNFIIAKAGATITFPAPHLMQPGEYFDIFSVISGSFNYKFNTSTNDDDKAILCTSNTHALHDKAWMTAGQNITTGYYHFRVTYLKDEDYWYAYIAAE